MADIPRETENMIAKLLGIDIEAERAKRKQEMIDYSYLLETLTPQQFLEQIIEQFSGDNIKQAALLAHIYWKVAGNG